MKEQQDAGPSLRSGLQEEASCGACVHGRANGLDRRTFLKSGAAALALLALAACGAGADATAPTNLPATTFKLSDNPSLATVGGVAVVTVGGSPVAIVRETATTASAFSLICPHAGSTVGVSGTTGFLCPGHGARFSLTGQWAGGQQTSNLISYPATYDSVAGSITVGS